MHSQERRFVSNSHPNAFSGIEWLDPICGRHLGRLIGLNSAYVKKWCFSSSENYFRNIVGIHGICIELLYLGIKILNGRLVVL